MNASQLAEALRVRRRREERALAAFNRAQQVQAEAEGKLAQATGALAAFDRRMQESLRAFEERARIGIDPNRIMGMRAFHGDQLKIRESFHEPITLAQNAVAAAMEATAVARHNWQKASQAAENLQEMSTTMARSAMRDLERRQEQDLDEIAAARATMSQRMDSP